MDTSNERPTQGAHGAVGGLTMESGDWRSQLERQKIMNKIMDILKKHLPFSGYERQQELKKIAEGVEEKIYAASSSQSEYTRKICLNMLTIETRLQTPMSNHPLPQTENPNGGDWQEEIYHKIQAMKKLYELESSDWRARLQAESRLKVVNKMVHSLTNHRPFLRHEELQELEKIAVRFEEKTYITARCQSDYLRKISLKMMKMKDRLSYSMPFNSAADSDNPLDPGSQVMQQANNQGQRYSIPVTSNNIQQMTSQSMKTNIGSAGMHCSSSLSSGLPPGSGLQQPAMANVAGQMSNLQNIQNLSSVQQNTVGNIMENNKFANQRQIPGHQQMVHRQQLQQQQTQNSQYLYRQHLQQMAKQAHIQQQRQMRSQMMHNNIGLTGMQGSSSFTSAMLPGSSLPQPTMQQLMLQEQVMQQQKLQQPMLQQVMLQQQRNVVQQNQQMARPTEGASSALADPTIESGDWRDKLQIDSRQRIRNKIIDTLKRHLPVSGEQELYKIAERLEEGFYAVATSQGDYLRKLSLKMLTIESRSQNPI